ncbi:tRNA-dihydrouridine(16/17) synthase [NAD(P)(+)] [Malassezia sp. CBS 17886]|nr:tRNA-dihydrouridine(16/17) synthase [NAD(P)(+)] [Malassezia sp. CBS 17886]
MAPAERPWYRYVAAPMVNQSDLAFRLTAVQFGATATWTELLQERDVFEHVARVLEQGRGAAEARDRVTGERAPQVVQLAGNNCDELVCAARAIAPYADGIDLNLGCPQARAKLGHYGGYLLGRRDWPLVEQLSASALHLCLTAAAALVRSVDLPVSTKIRLCDSAADTPALAMRLAHAGAHIVTLHARHVAPNRRRAGAAKLAHVRDIVDALCDGGLHVRQPSGRTAVLSNGNVRTWEDVVGNLSWTCADGVMVGEPLLAHPECVAVWAC